MITQGKITNSDYPQYYTPVLNYIGKIRIWEKKNFSIDTDSNTDILPQK